MEKLLKKLLYGEQSKTIPNKSKPNTILARYERVQRLRNIAINESCKGGIEFFIYGEKLKQANRILFTLTNQLNQINSYQYLNYN